MGPISKKCLRRSATVRAGEGSLEDFSPLDWAIRPLRKYAVFAGRAPRAEYWWFYGAWFIASALLEWGEKAVGADDWLSSIFGLALALPYLAVTVRRLHDINRTGWWLAILVAILAVAVIVTAVVGTRNDGTAATVTVGMLMILALLGTVVTLFVFAILPGTEGPNRYGPDPYGPSELEEVFA